MVHTVFDTLKNKFAECAGYIFLWPQQTWLLRKSVFQTRALIFDATSPQTSFLGLRVEGETLRQNEAREKCSNIKYIILDDVLLLHLIAI